MSSRARASARRSRPGVVGRRRGLGPRLRERRRRRRAATAGPNPTRAKAAMTIASWRVRRSTARGRREEHHALGVPGDLREVADHGRLAPGALGGRHGGPHAEVELATKLGSIRRSSSSATSGSPSASRTSPWPGFIRTSFIDRIMPAACGRRPPAEPEDVHRPGARAESRQAVADRLGRDLARPPRGFGELRALREERREGRLSECSPIRATRRPGTEARRSGASPTPSKRTSAPSSSQCPPVTMTAAGAERLDRPRQLLARSARSPRPASSRASGRFGVATVARGRTRSISAALAFGSSSDRPARGHHHGSTTTGASPIRSSASTTASMVGSSPSMPTLTRVDADVPGDRPNLGDDHLRRDRGDHLDPDRVLRRERGDRGASRGRRSARTPSGRPGCPAPPPESEPAIDRHVATRAPVFMRPA